MKVCNLVYEPFISHKYFNTECGKQSALYFFCPKQVSNARAPPKLNRRKSRAPPATQPSLIFKDLRRLRCWWSLTLKIYDG